ncbi:hypothetical protein PPACK8108_LOCUS7184 [Phakopsora pachyrhizi]|uniref:Uncharacterized protein n=1 Tax=Phakopsora pachyrhizi TaxID=170000 RepID=A0AAV0AU39_PHAPC|nr:hypothetical protein PPACK8108_LOCUS7184 [Phakopsora pachyrhizi]
MTLSGLPPSLSNQEYHTLFIATSNIASALELFTPVVEELNRLATTGVIAFDESIQQERSITGPGVKDVLNQAIIKTVKENQDSKVIFKISNIQEENIHKLFNPFFDLKGFNGHEDTLVEVFHVVLLGILKYLYRDLINNLSSDQKDELIARLQSFDTNNLNIPPIKAKYLVQHYLSLVGKDFKVLIQAAPFVFFPLIQEAKHKMWTSLCHLCSIIFQTHIVNLKSYLSNLNYYTQDFLLKLISTNAQWVNKPKFHILLHLSQSVIRFGPASLFATEKFESYNGVVRQASIHSNRQSPSHDIANTFNHYSALRYCLSGGMLQPTDSRTKSSHFSNVKLLLLKNPTIQNLLGLEPNFFKQSTRYPCITLNAQKKCDVHKDVPSIIKTQDLNAEWLNISSFDLDKHQTINANTFISVKPQEINQNNFIAFISDIWAVDKFSYHKIYIQCKRCEILEVDQFYGMRNIRKLLKEETISATNVISGLNIQHNCVRAGCPIKRTLPRKLEKQPTDMMLKEVHHDLNYNLYVINTGSLRASEKHHSPARIPNPHIRGSQN